MGKRNRATSRNSREGGEEKKDRVEILKELSLSSGFPGIAMEEPTHAEQGRHLGPEMVQESLAQD